MKYLPCPETTRVKKNFIKVFKCCRLKAITKAIFYILNFLDITLGLRNNTSETYKKPVIYPVNIDKSYNHRKQILRELPKSISKILSNLLSNN